MDDHDITTFIQGLDDAGAFAGRGTHEAAATSVLLHRHRSGQVDAWLRTAITALRDGMRDDVPPPVARALLQTAHGVHSSEAEPCCATDWFIDELKRWTRDLPEVWVALAIPDLAPSRVSVEAWNPANLGHGVNVSEMRWFVEIRGRGLGLDRGKLVQTGRTPLLTDAPVELRATDDPRLMRMGRRILRGHPVRRASR